jgi:hypothetical protein
MAAKTVQVNKNKIKVWYINHIHANIDSYLNEYIYIYIYNKSHIMYKNTIAPNSYSLRLDKKTLHFMVSNKYLDQ